MTLNIVHGSESMIKILKKPGQHEYNCGCGCTFTFENEDVKYEYFSDDTEYFTINCPYCKRVLGTAFIIDNDDRSKIREMWRNKNETSIS